MPIQEDKERRGLDATAELRKSEEFNRSLMDATPDCVKVLDLDGRLLHMNTPGLSAMEIDDFGSVCWLQWAAIWPADARDDIERSMAVAVRGEVSSFQAFCPTAKGTPKWWEVTVSPVRDTEGGQVVRLLALSRDITQRKEAESMLRQSEGRLSKLHHIISNPALSNPDRLTRLVLLGIEAFSLENGVIAEISDGLYRVALAVTPGKSVPVGFTCDAKDVICVETFRRNDLLAIESLAQSDWRHHRAYAQFGTEIYFGMPLPVGGKIFGTLCYTSRTPRAVSFNTGDHEFFRLLVQTIGTEMTRQQIADELSDSEERLRLSLGERSQLLSQVETERARLGEVFRQAPGFMCVLRGPDHIFDRLNDRYLQLVGHRDILGKPVRDALPEVVEQGFVALLDGVYQTGETFVGTNVRISIARQPGQPLEERYVDFVYEAQRGTRGDITGVMVLGMDVTNRHQADEQLRTSEEQYRSLFESIDEGYCVIEVMFNVSDQAIDYRFLEVNPAFEKHTGMIGATGQTMRTLVPEMETHWFDIYGRVARSGEPIRFVDQAQAMEGRWFDIFAFRLGGSGSNKVAVLFSDISDRMTTEKLLSESEERYRVAIKTVSDVIWTNTAEGYMKGEQGEWGAFTGQPCDAYGGYGWLNAIHPEDKQPTIDAWKRTVAEKRAFEFEHRVQRHDGEWRLCSVRAVPILNNDETVREWVGVHADITDQKRDEEKLRQLAAELSETNLRKDEFLATLAHELRNPLAPIRNGLQLMKLAGGQTEAMEQARAMMERQLTQMVRLVDDLMDVSRISQGKLELRKERVSLATVLNSAVETSLPLIEKMGHKLTIGLPEQPIMVDADTTRLAQVFLNLLNNAAKYSDQSGHIQLNVELQDGDAVVSVQDTGIGIAADQLPRIFEMFTQVGGSLEQAQGGLGIGLTLVKKLVEMHGGQVEARSEGPGKGSQFRVRLPVVSEASEALAPCVNSERNPSRSSLRILIVDDSRDGADSMAEMLQIMGNDTRTAYDGQQGVDTAAEYRPDVILFDIGMPKLNGYEACRLIRQQPWGKRVVLVAVTGWGQDKDRARTREAGFDHHLVKPVDPQELMTMLSGLSVDHRVG